MLGFDTTAFYLDLVEVCKSAKQKEWGGVVMSRYNSWLTYDLDAVNGKQNVAAAISEINAMFSNTAGPT